ncbi:MAG: hypothetical protein F6J87_17305 [Spirulina sp. SIO3F2]|nr:hypothetical protein [Spirulina sp. SIO3F2]
MNNNKIVKTSSQKSQPTLAEHDLWWRNQYAYLYQAFEDQPDLIERMVMGSYTWLYKK